MDHVAWGLIGTGDIVRKRVAAALSDAAHSSILAVTRRRADELSSFARRYSIERTYTEWEDMVEDRDVGAVYIATPVHLHAPMTVAAAEAGKHVLCEKPMALTVEECDRMIAAASASGVKLGIAYYRHFYPVVRRVGELIEEGAVGKPVVAQINAFEQFDPEPDHPRAWLLDENAAGGGPLYDFGCHRIEVLIHLFGSAASATGCLDRIVFERDVEDTAVGTLRFDDGPVAVLSVSHGPSEPQDTLDIFGTRGSIHVPVLNEGSLRVVRNGERRGEHHPPHANLHQPLIEQFVRSVRGEEAPSVDGYVGREVNRLLELIAR